jgi:adenylosuccinate synthase
MPCSVVVGAQWGDEGKGKIVDTLAERADVVARYQGGNNAGHTLVLGDDTYKLRLVPSGILWPGTLCVIGNGCVIDPEVLMEELDGLEQRGIDLAGFRISGNAHLIMPWHRIIDADSELMLGRLQIGTTRRGIGPAYADKASRVGIRVQDLLDEKILRQKIQTALSVKNVILRKIYHQRPIDKDVMTEATLRYAERIRPFIADTSLIVNRALDEGKVVLCEGAQATLLDLDHGTYPFVTSSNPIAAGACVGLGFGPTRIDAVLGVAKAYVTRVGAGGFPSEADPERGERIRDAGAEYGTVTGHPAERLHPARPDQAGRALDLRVDPGLHPLHAARRHGHRGLPRPPERLPPRPARVHRAARLEHRHLARARRRAAAGRRSRLPRLHRAAGGRAGGDRGHRPAARPDHHAARRAVRRVGPALPSRYPAEQVA